MEQFIPAALINGAVVVLLWGLVWRSHNQRLDAISVRTSKKVDRDLCHLKHEGIREDMQEIKLNQEKMFKTLEEVRMHLARENGKAIMKKEMS